MVAAQLFLSDLPKFFVVAAESIRFQPFEFGQLLCIPENQNDGQLPME